MAAFNSKKVFVFCFFKWFNLVANGGLTQDSRDFIAVCTGTGYMHTGSLVQFTQSGFKKTKTKKPKLLCNE